MNRERPLERVVSLGLAFASSALLGACGEWNSSRADRVSCLAMPLCAFTMPSAMNSGATSLEPLTKKTGLQALPLRAAFTSSLRDAFADACGGAERYSLY